MGGITSLRMAGIDVSGVPLRYVPPLDGMISRFFEIGQLPDVD
jgi:hypothetical protein